MQPHARRREPAGGSWNNNPHTDANNASLGVWDSEHDLVDFGFGGGTFECASTNAALEPGQYVVCVDGLLSQGVSDLGVTISIETETL